MVEQERTKRGGRDQKLFQPCVVITDVARTDPIADRFFPDPGSVRRFVREQ
jgi:hypothetical protein